MFNKLWPKLSDLTPSPRGKRHFTYSPRRTDLEIVAIHKKGEWYASELLTIS